MKRGPAMMLSKVLAEDRHERTQYSSADSREWTDFVSPGGRLSGARDAARLSVSSHRAGLQPLHTFRVTTRNWIQSGGLVKEWHMDEGNPTMFQERRKPGCWHPTIEGSVGEGRPLREASEKATAAPYGCTTKRTSLWLTARGMYCSGLTTGFTTGDRN